MEPGERGAGPELLTPPLVRRLLVTHGLAPRKSAGQNFVVDPNTIRKLVRDAGVVPEDTVLEVGPGLGSLTLGLASAAHRVVAIEIDAGLVRALRHVLRDISNVELVHADALSADLAALVDGGPARFVANLPYNLATPIVLAALETGAFPHAHVMVQREVGERWAAGPRDPAYGAVSVKIALLSVARTVAVVPRTVFHPVPNVDSVTVHLTLRADALAQPLRSWVFEVIDAAFAMRRKTLRNTLRAVYPEDTVVAALGDTGIDAGARAEELSPDDFVALATAMHQGAPAW